MKTIVGVSLRGHPLQGASTLARYRNLQEGWPRSATPTTVFTQPLPRDGTDFIALLFHSLYKTLVYKSDRTNTTLLHIHVEALGRVVAENPADSLLE